METDVEYRQAIAKEETWEETEADSPEGPRVAGPVDSPAAVAVAAGCVRLPGSSGGGCSEGAVDAGVDAGVDGRAWPAVGGNNGSTAMRTMSSIMRSSSLPGMQRGAVDTTTAGQKQKHSARVLGNGSYSQSLAAHSLHAQTQRPTGAWHCLAYEGESHAEGPMASTTTHALPCHGFWTPR